MARSRGNAAIGYASDNGAGSIAPMYRCPIGLIALIAMLDHHIRDLGLASGSVRHVAGGGQWNSNQGGRTQHGGSPRYPRRIK